MLDYLHLGNVGEVGVGVAQLFGRQHFRGIHYRHVQGRQKEALTPQPLRVALEKERLGA